MSKHGDPLEAITLAFDALMKRHGFKGSIGTAPGTAWVEYRGKVAFVNVCHGPPEYEVEVTVGARGVDDKPKSGGFDLLSLLIEIGAVPEDLRTLGGHGVADRANNFAIALDDSRLLVDIALLESALSTLRARRATQFAAWLAGMRVSDCRRNAIAAWKAKDWRAVVDAYEAMAADLLESERKRLDMARRHLE